MYFGNFFIENMKGCSENKSFKTPCLFLHNIIGYGTEPSGYGDDDVLPDLTPFLILGIAILGLSLLFPTSVHIPNVGPGTGTGTGGGIFAGQIFRKRRYADEGISTIRDPQCTLLVLIDFYPV